MKGDQKAPLAVPITPSPPRAQRTTVLAHLFMASEASIKKDSAGYYSQVSTLFKTCSINTLCLTIQTQEVYVILSFPTHPVKEPHQQHPQSVFQIFRSSLWLFPKPHHLPSGPLRWPPNWSPCFLSALPCVVHAAAIQSCIKSVLCPQSSRCFQQHIEQRSNS